MTDEKESYVHGYSEREAERLLDQGRTLTGLLHHDTRYPAGSRVLEAGCGVGAQTVTLASRSPDAQFTSVDCSERSIAEAEKRIRDAGLTNVRFQQADIFNLPFETEHFDHVFVCFVLEHFGNPEAAIASLKRVLRPGGTITVIEGDHGSTFFHPDSPYAQKAVGCLVTLQKEMGGNSLIGREIYPLLIKAGFLEVNVSPRMVYVDASRPDLVDGFIKQTFTAMVEGVREAAIGNGLISEADWKQGIADLYRTAEPDGVFCYTFFKGTGVK